MYIVEYDKQFMDYLHEQFVLSFPERDDGTQAPFERVHEEGVTFVFLGLNDSNDSRIIGISKKDKVSFTKALKDKAIDIKDEDFVSHNLVYDILNLQKYKRENQNTRLPYNPEENF